MQIRIEGSDLPGRSCGASGTLDGDRVFTMFRRAKLWLDDLAPAVVAASRASGQLVARLGLTDDKRHPLCAAVRPPKIEWSAGD